MRCKREKIVRWSVDWKGEVEMIRWNSLNADIISSKSIKSNQIKKIKHIKFQKIRYNLEQYKGLPRHMYISSSLMLQ